MITMAMQTFLAQPCSVKKFQMTRARNPARITKYT